MTSVPKAEVFRRKPTYNEVLSLIEADPHKVTLPERTSVEFSDHLLWANTAKCYNKQLRATAALLSTNRWTPP